LNRGVKKWGFLKWCIVEWGFPNWWVVKGGCFVSWRLINGRWWLRRRVAAIFSKC